MGFPGNSQAEPVKAAIESTLEKIAAAGRTPGMPAATNNIDDVLGRGVRYVYTHLPKVLPAGSNGFFQAATRKSENIETVEPRACRNILHIEFAAVIAILIPGC
jgi:2-keto-3-deoxy-L-rhamnonate aldolase RhmA